MSKMFTIKKTIIITEYDNVHYGWHCYIFDIHCVLGVNRIEEKRTWENKVINFLYVEAGEPMRGRGSKAIVELSFTVDLL